MHLLYLLIPYFISISTLPLLLLSEEIKPLTLENQPKSFHLDLPATDLDTWATETNKMLYVVKTNLQYNPETKDPETKEPSQNLPAIDPQPLGTNSIHPDNPHVQQKFEKLLKLDPEKIGNELASFKRKELRAIQQSPLYSNLDSRIREAIETPRQTLFDDSYSATQIAAFKNALKKIPGVVKTLEGLSQVENLENFQTAFLKISILDLEVQVSEEFKSYIEGSDNVNVRKAYKSILQFHTADSISVGEDFELAVGPRVKFPDGAESTSSINSASASILESFKEFVNSPWSEKFQVLKREFLKLFSYFNDLHLITDAFWNQLFGLKLFNKPPVDVEFVIQELQKGNKDILKDLNENDLYLIQKSDMFKTLTKEKQLEVQKLTVSSRKEMRALMFESFNVVGQGIAPVVEKAYGHVRFMSYNTNKFKNLIGETNLDGAMEQIKATNPDILTLQEVDKSQVLSILGKMTNNPNLGIDPVITDVDAYLKDQQLNPQSQYRAFMTPYGGRNGLLTFKNKVLLTLVHVKYDSHQEKETYLVDRTIPTIIIKTSPTDLLISFHPVHMSHASATLKSLQLSAASNFDPAISRNLILGDFNMDSEEIQKKTRNVNLVNLGVVPDGMHSHWRQMTVDHAYSDPSFMNAISSKGLVNILASDHYPIYFDLDLTKLPSKTA